MSGLRARRSEDQRGAVAVMVAISLSAVLVASGLVLDFGLVRIDRQVDKAAADAATIAGIHGLNNGVTTTTHPYAGVCTALRYLRVNSARFSGMTSAGGTWKDGNGAVTGNGCNAAALQAKECSASDKSTWASYTWSGTYAGAPLQVSIKSGYVLPTAAATTNKAEDNLSASLADANDNAGGCDQLAVSITQARQPTFGSLATSGDLVSTIRSVGRAKSGPSGYVPAMLLLKRTGCPVLAVGSAGGGANSYIHVLGALASNGATQPGIIHADTDGTGCTGSSGNNVFNGKASDGIVAYAAPLASNPTAADPTKPGSMTSVAGYKSVGIGIVRDSSANVYASAAVGPSGAGSATKAEPAGRPLVTREPVDARYNAGVRAIVSTAQTSVFGLLTAANAAANGYTVVTCSGGNISTLPTPTPAKLFVSCSNLKSAPTMLASTIVFSGTVSPSASLQMPNATKVYIFGGGDAISLGSGNEFHLHTSGNTDVSGNCTTTQSLNNRAILVIKSGGIKQTGGTLQLCRTTMIMMGGAADGCVPVYPYATAPAPSQTPCSGGTTGTGQIKQNGGTVDWTAPDGYDTMTLANGDPDPSKSAAWSSADGPEDLAFWTESSSNSTSNTSSMGGGALLRVRGVFMTPNYDPFTIGGNGLQNLTNAQYIASSIALNGNVQLLMSVDPNAAVPVPKLLTVGLVR